MCGIAGFIRPQESASHILHDMMRSIAHRGPDDHGQYIDDKVALGHQRLSIIDLKTGHQPMANADHSVWIVFNGEIYNYSELNRDLLARGHRFVTTSDTETLLHLYDEYGEHCVDYLNGMFAFAIYDSRRGRLFAVRDRFGIKPFYYVMAKDQFIFGSEIKALLQHPALEARLNRKALTEYVLLQLCMGNKTLFEGVCKLEPAHCLSYDLSNGEGRVWEYWRPRYEPDSAITEVAAIEELDCLLRDSVRLQLRSDVPIGTYLSGGLDSSLVTCLAADMDPHAIKTFTGRFSEPGPFDESAYAKAVVASRSNLEYHEIVPTPGDFLDSLSTLIHHMDEPAGGPGIFAQYMVATLAAKHVKVVLGGQGGDELFGGYTRYFLLNLLQRLGKPLQITRFSDNPIGMFWKHRTLLRDYFPAIKKLIRDGQFKESWAKIYFRLINRSEKAAMHYHADVLDPTHMAGIQEEFETLFNRPENGSVYERAAYFDFKTLLPALLQVEDRVSMAVSIESRVPLLDHRIVEFMNRLPSHIKFKDGELKYLLKKTARKTVPSLILERKDKMGFPVPLVQWTKGPLNKFVRDTLMSNRSRERGIFSNDAIISDLSREQPFSRDLWGSLCLELWFQNFIDHKPRGDRS